MCQQAHQAADVLPSPGSLPQPPYTKPLSALAVCLLPCSSSPLLFLPESCHHPLDADAYKHCQIISCYSRGLQGQVNGLFRKSWRPTGLRTASGSKRVMKGLWEEEQQRGRAIKACQQCQSFAMPEKVTLPGSSASSEAGHPVKTSFHSMLGQPWFLGVWQQLVQLQSAPAAGCQGSR